MSTPPANWYPDPKGEAELRYWDGTQWTEHTHSGQPAAAPAAPPPAAAPPPQAPPPSGQPGAGTPTEVGYAPQQQAYQQQPYQPTPAAGPAASSTGGGSKLPLIIGGVIALLAIGVVLALVLGGGGDDGGGEEAKVEDAIKEISTSKDPEVCETGYTDNYLQKALGQSGSEAKILCEQRVRDNKTTGVEVSDVKVDGDRATAKAVEDGGSYDGETLELVLVKEGDDWKANDLDRPEVAQGEAAERAIVNTVLNFGSSEGSNGCIYWSYPGLQSLGGADRCEKSFAKNVAANYSPEDPSITGKTATLVVTETKRDKRIQFTLSRELGEWEIDSVKALS